ncbi:hypothetical protein ETH_00042160, partial [Eimeria tenella]
MGGPPGPGWLGALAGLPRTLLKGFIVHFEPTLRGPPGAPWGPPGGPPFPSLTLRETLALARYRWRQWVAPRGAPGGSPTPATGPPGGPSADPSEAPQGVPPGEPPGAPGEAGGPHGGPPYRPPAIWPSRLCLPEGPPPPEAADIPEGLLRVQALGHGTFLLQTRGAPGGIGGPLNILTDPFFSRRAGPWGRIG